MAKPLPEVKDLRTQFKTDDGIVKVRRRRQFHHEKAGVSMCGRLGLARVRVSALWIVE